MNTQLYAWATLPRFTSGIGIVVTAFVLVALGLRIWLHIEYDHVGDLRSSPGACVKVPGVAHGEDVKVDWSRQRAFVGAFVERDGLARGIYRIDLANGLSLTNVTPQGLPGELHPLGLSLYTAPGGRQKLFAINRMPVPDRDSPTAHSVLIFDVAEEGTLTFDSEVKGPEIYNPDALTAVGPRQFYLTNDHRGTDDDLDTWFGRLYFLLGLDTSSDLVFFDGEKFRTIAQGLRLADGLNQSPDGTRLYLTEGFGQSLTTFARDPQTNVLSFLSKTRLPGAPDNIEVSPDGTLFVALFPNMLDTLAYLVSNGRAKRPSSEVLELTPAGDTFEVKPAWIDDGQRITVVTTGAPYAKTENRYSLLLSTISPQDDYVLACAPAEE